MREAFWVILFPAALAWAAVTKLRRRFYPASRRYRSPLPVLCVGNIHSGGSGKTPLVAAIATHFRELSPVIVSRGYRGRREKRGGWVELDHADGPAEFGDEPWMLARAGLRVRVGRDRVASVRAVETDGFSPVILDDGFQHLALQRTLDLVTIDTSRWPAHSYCLPLGELREPLGALAAASAVVLVDGEHHPAWVDLLERNFPELSRFDARKIPDGVWDDRGPVASLPDRLGGFCAIAGPDGFRKALAASGDIAFFQAFPDHHAYSAGDVARLLARGKDVGRWVTTEKDWFKARPLFSARGVPLLRLRIRYEISDAFWYFLRNRWITK